MYIITGFHIEEHCIEAVFTKEYVSTKDIGFANPVVKIARWAIRERDIHTFRFQLYKTDIIKLNITPFGILTFGKDLMNYTTTSN